MLFATPETAPAGRFLDYPAEWGARGGELIRGEKLPFAAVPAGSEGALVAELASSVARRSPLLMMFWAPHWALSEHPHRWVEIPPRLVEKYGLQRPQIFKAAWPGAREKWPAAYRFLRAYRMNNRTQESMMKLVDGEGRDVVEVTRRWVDENEPIWRRWVEAAMPAGKDH